MSESDRSPNYTLHWTAPSQCSVAAGERARLDPGRMSGGAKMAPHDLEVLLKGLS